MTTFWILVLLAASLGATLFLAKRRLDQMTSKEKKAFLKTSLNNVYIWAEDKGLLDRTPAFDHDYLDSYPKLALLEENHEVVRRECLALLGIKDKLTDVAAIGGAYTQAGIHIIKWKSFMFKSGEFIEENCQRCPETTKLLKQIPDVYTAFFSVVDPHQYITPHWGYYKGFVRYHLGVIIPNDNANKECWLRVNSSREANAPRNAEAIEDGEVYYWKNGEGIVFDDNYLHDAANDSDEVRVVMWLDMRRKMPLPLHWFNMLCLWLVHRDKSVRKIRENARIDV